MRRGRGLAVLALMLGVAMPARAQGHYPLKITSPMATAASPDGLDADHRTKRAYTGLTYKVRVAVIGGYYPYTFELNNEPAGMTIVAGPCTTIGVTCRAGEITWTNPTSTATNVEVVVTDAMAQTDTETWTITVSTTGCTTAGGWCFLDADDGNDTTGAGTLASPWQTFDKLYDSSAANTITYMRGATATYTLTGVPTASSGLELRTEWNEASRSVIWLGYPGEESSVVFDFIGNTAAPTDYVPRARMTGNTYYLAHFTAKNPLYMAWQFTPTAVSSYGPTMYDMVLNDAGPGSDGTNSAWMMTVNASPTAPHFGGVFCNNTVTNADFNVVKHYNSLQPLICDNTLTNVDGAFEEKAEVSQFTIRGNDFVSGGIFCCGNMNWADASHTTYGEIAFNRVLSASTATAQLGDAKVNTIGAVYLYRNTFLGTVAVKNLVTADGPYTYRNNVFVNAGGTGGSCPQRLSCTSVTDYARIDLDSSNIQGSVSDNVADSNGLLQGAYRTTYLGTAGWELGTATPVSITGSPLPAGTVGSAYSQNTSAVGGTGTYTWSESGAAMGSGACSGLTFGDTGNNGIASGTPTTAGTCSFTALVTDSAVATDTQAYEIVVQAVAQAPGTSLPAGVLPRRLRGALFLPLVPAAWWIWRRRRG